MKNIHKWIKEQLTNLHTEALCHPDTFEMWKALDKWYHEKGNSLIRNVNPDVFLIEQSYFNGLQSVELKLKYLMDFPYLTRMYANANAQKATA